MTPEESESDTKEYPAVAVPNVGLVMRCKDGEQEAVIADHFARFGKLDNGIRYVVARIPSCGLSRSYTIKDFPRCDSAFGETFWVKWELV
jgi:hypothetical protein